MWAETTGKKSTKAQWLLTNTKSENTAATIE